MAGPPGCAHRCLNLSGPGGASRSCARRIAQHGLHALDAIEEVRRCGGFAVDITDTDDAVELGPCGRFDVVLIVCGRYPPFDLVERLGGAPVVVDPSPSSEPLCHQLDLAVAI